jgi:hypothetical protein
MKFIDDVLQYFGVILGGGGSGGMAQSGQQGKEALSKGLKGVQLGYEIASFTRV